MKKKSLIILISFAVILSIGSVNASQKITATPDDYFAYYGADTPAGQTHSFAIEVDSNVYYISDQTANRLASYSPYFRKAYDYCLRKYSNKFRPDAISFGSNGFNAYYQLDSTPDDEMFQFHSDRTFDFEYETGQQVGYNRNAKVITRIYYPSGGEITETAY